MVEYFYDKYLDSPVHKRNEYLAPLLAEDLSDLPPATVLTVEFDPLRDEGLAYAEKLSEHGVDATNRHYEDMIHGFVVLTDFLDRGDEALDDLSADLAGAF
jgi:acetyl esterase